MLFEALVQELFRPHEVPFEVLLEVLFAVALAEVPAVVAKRFTKSGQKEELPFEDVVEAVLFVLPHLHDIVVSTP